MQEIMQWSTRGVGKALVLTYNDLPPGGVPTLEKRGWKIKSPFYFKYDDSYQTLYSCISQFDDNFELVHYCRI